MAAQPLSIGIVGAGGRIRTVYANIAEAAGEQTRIVCFYDTDPAAAEHVRELPGGADARAVASYREVIDDPSVNAVMIGTPNAFHTDPAVYAMESGKPLYLEKPLATTLQDHRRLLQVRQRTDARVVVGFVLRYTPFYAKVQELVSSDMLGRVMYLQATEHMGIWLTADCYLRGWRAQRDIAGPLLLEKCCHDIDIVNWVLGRRCEAVGAVTDRTVFVPRSDRPERCSLCDDTACPYRAAGTSAEHAADNTGQEIYVSGANDLCVYNSRKDIADHTTVLARYEGGIHVSFNVTMGVARGERRIRIVGSKAQLSGCAEGNTIVLERLHADARPETIVPERLGTGGHYGGDAVLARQFVNVARDPGTRIDASVEDGFESGVICLAADEAARTGQTVDVARYRES
jgi:predicted dehydrogenase